VFGLSPGDEIHSHYWLREREMTDIPLSLSKIGSADDSSDTSFLWGVPWVNCRA
jgi:hypothetical protein